MLKLERKLLKELRLKKNLTQQELADNLGISAVYVRKIEKGDVNAGLPTMIKYESFFGVSMRKLFPDIFLEVNDKKLINNNKRAI
ncbi:helix-turn-helix domain-containing protein [Sporosarcina sp. ITBMC105]